MLPRPPAPLLRLTALLLTLLLATGLRFYRIEYQSYWNDEGNSRAMTEKNLAAILQSAAADIHPPAYYLALKAWVVFTGESEFALRSFSALAGIVLIALLYRLGKEYFDTSAGIAAALFGAVNPFLIYYSQEARMYSLLVTFGAGSFWLFSKWLKSTRPLPLPQPSPVRHSLATLGALSRERGQGRESNSPPLSGIFPTGAGAGVGVAYCLTTISGLYTHYSFPFILIAQNLAALGGLLAHRTPNWKQRLSAWAVLQFVVFTFFIPWLPTAYRQLTTWPSAREFHPFLAALADVTRYLAFGRTIKTEDVTLALLAVGLLLLISLTRKGQTITPLLWLIVPAGLTLAFGLLSEAFSKFLLVAVPPLCLLLGNALVWSNAQSSILNPSNRILKYGSGSLKFGIWLLGFGIFFYSTYLSLTNLYFNPTYFRDNYRGIEQYIERVRRAGDAVILISPNQIETFSYYHSSDAEVFPLPHARPLDKAETASALNHIAATHDRLFVLYWGDEQADPQHFVEDWLNTNTFKAGDEWYGTVRLATYAAASPAGEMTVPSGARFGTPYGDITLAGYTLKSTTLTPGDILQITLFWKTDVKLAERYKVFVHLYAALDAPPPAQQDGEPGGGRAPTVDWQPEQIYPDNHGVLIPADLSPGEYTLMIGLYNPVDGNRLGVTLAGTTAGDRLPLGTISVK